MSEVLHAVRVKGIAPTEAVVVATGLAQDDVERELAELEQADLVLQRPSRKRPGWVLTETGRERHAEWLAGAHDAPTVERLATIYEGFLAVNSDVKAASARWQGASSPEARLDLVDQIEDLHAKAAPVLAEAGGEIPRYGRYGERLGVALERLDEDPRYFVSPLVDSYHTVWFECHEDFLLTLGRTRAGEGSE